MFRHSSVEPIAPIDPFDALPALGQAEYVAVLESRGPITPFSRYSFLATDPAYVFRSRRARAWAGPIGDVRPRRGRPLDVLGSLLERHRGESAWSPGLPSFLGGWVGYLGYELLYELEDVPDSGRDDFGLPDCWLVLYDSILVTDWLKQKSWIVATCLAESPLQAARASEARLRDTRLRLKGVAAAPPARSGAGAGLPSRRLDDSDLARQGVRPVLDHRSYLRVVEAAREHILAGDVFEVCTTNRFDVTSARSGLDLYRALRNVNEAPFAAYLRFGEVEIASSSPERFLRLDRDRRVETRPIKGTRPRGATPEADAALRAELAASEKDGAENVMIADLARNDLGRVCEFGSIAVPELCAVESHPFCHQLVSTVRGRLRAGVNPVDLLRAAFPGGSMTGAPKIEAMKIIDRLEPVKRGVFSGSIGYFDHDGALDLNIVIRTFVKRGEQCSFHAGGAIVHDSDPEEEHQEMLDKAHALVTALELVA